MNTNNLPPLPAIDSHDHTEPHTMKWSALEIKLVQYYASEYGKLCFQQALAEAAKVCDDLWQNDETAWAYRYVIRRMK